MLALKRNEIISKAFAVTGEDVSLLYDLKARASRRRPKDMIPVKECERKEKKDEVTIKYLALESSRFKYLSIKYNE